MKHDLIKTDNYLLVVDESEITKGNWHLANDVMITKSHLIDENCKKIIAHLPLNGSPILEGVDLLPPLPSEEDVEKLAEQEYSEQTKSYENDVDEPFYNYPEYLKVGFITGYKKAKEKYKFTEEDLRKALWELGDVLFNNNQHGIKEGEPQQYFDTIIQSLSQPKMPIGFECEMEDTFTDGYTHDRVRRFYGKKPKTTTTPEGHTQWVGTYIYE